MERKNSHEKVQMKKNRKYVLLVEKILVAHRWRCNCECSEEVMNLLGGLRAWTRIEFECGERIKVNCHCLKKL